MSTKIYNGFKIKHLNLKEQLEFNNEVTKLAETHFLDLYANLLADKLVTFIDHISYLDYNKDYEKLEDYLKKCYRKQYPVEKILRDSRFGASIDIDINNVIKTLSMSYYSVFTFINNILEEDLKFGEISKDIMSIESDVESTLVLFPITKKKTLIMTYSENFTNFFRKLCNDKSFCEKYELEEYHYQNQTDKPDDIPQRSWTQRKKDWDKALLTGIPSSDGMVIKLLDAEKFTMPLLLKTKEIKKLVMDKIPLRSVRIKKMTQTNTSDKYWEIYKEKNKITKYSYTEIMDSNDEFRKRYKENDIEIIELIKATEKEATEYIPFISEENLKNPVIDWMPNYKKDKVKDENNSKS